MMVRWTFPVADTVSILISFAAARAARSDSPNVTPEPYPNSPGGRGRGPVARRFRLTCAAFSRAPRAGAQYSRRRARAIWSEGGADRRRHAERLRRPEGLALRAGCGGCPADGQLGGANRVRR